MPRIYVWMWKIAEGIKILLVSVASSKVCGMCDEPCFKTG